MPKKIISILATVFFSVLVGSGIVYAATTRNITAKLGGVANDQFDISGILKVNALRVTGTSFLGGPIVNPTLTKGVDNPITYGDNVRIDGRIWRGTTAGPGDGKPFIINDDAQVTGSLAAGAITTGTLTTDTLTIGGVAAARHKVYSGTIDLTASGDLITTSTITIDCTNQAASWIKSFSYHWKRVDIAEMDLNNPPLIVLSYKLSATNTTYPANSWITPSSFPYPMIYNQGYILFTYKTVLETCGGTVTPSYYTSGEYKVVVDY